MEAATSLLTAPDPPVAAEWSLQLKDAQTKAVGDEPERIKDEGNGPPDATVAGRTGELLKLCLGLNGG
jgi:hypothetical protein